MDYISIRTEPFKAKQMSKEERCIIIETLTREGFGDSCNILNLIETLCHNGIMDVETYTQFMRIYREKEESNFPKMWIKVYGLLDQLSYDNILDIFYSCGCVIIVQMLKDRKFGGYGAQIYRRCVPHAKSSLFRHYNIKYLVDNNMLKTPINNLKFQIDRQENEMKNTRAAPKSRLAASDYKVLLSVHRLHRCTSYEERRAILEDMKTIVSKNVSDTATVDMVYHSKMAVIEAKQNNRYEALVHAQKAEELASKVEPCFASILSVPNHQYVYRQLYINSHSPDDLEKILKIGNRVMDLVADVKEEIHNQCKRTVLLYQAMSILQITNKLEISTELPKPRLDQIKLAGNILSDVRRSLHDIETRREMIYFICMARLRDLENNLDAALTYQGKAVELSANGTFDETEKLNIDKYMNQSKGKAQIIMK